MATKAGQGWIELNGVRYVTEGPIVEQPVDDWGETTRVQGLQDRLDLLYRSSWRIKLDGGLLRARDEKGETGGFWDSTLETRFADEGLVCLPPLLQNATTVTMAAAGYNDVGVSSGFIAVFYKNASNGASQLYFNGTSWATGVIDAATQTMPTRGGRIAVFQDNIHVWLTNVGSGNGIFGGLGGTPTQLTGTGTPGASSAEGRFLLVLGARLYAFQGTGVVLYKTSVAGDATWTSAGSLTVGDTPTSASGYWNEDGVTLPHITTQTGLWRTDIDGINATLVVDLTPYGGGTDTGRGTVFWPQAGSLMVPIDNGQGGLLQVQVIPGQGRIVKQVGLDQGTGILAANQASIVELLPVGKWLFALLEPGSGGAAFVYAFDGTRWHYITKRTDAQVWGLAFSSLGGKPTLYLIGDNNTTTLDIDKLENITLNPEAVATYDVAVNGYIDLAYFGGGLSELPTAYLRFIADVDSLSATTAGEYIAVAYGTNGAARTTTALGNLLSGDLDLDFASKVGVSARTLGIRLTFYRDAGNTTDNPKWRGGSIDYRKKPAVRRAWRFRLNLEDSASYNSRTSEDIIAGLWTVAQSVTQVTFSMPHLAQVYVAPQLPWAFVYTPSDSVDPLEGQPRNGFLDIVVVEMTP